MTEGPPASELMNMPLNEVLVWLLGGGGGIVTGGLLYRLFGARTSVPPKDASQAQETLVGMVRTMGEIRDGLREFCTAVRADHTHQAEAMRAQAEALQRMSERLAQIDARINRGA